MKKLSTGEWIAVSVAVVLGFALFLVGYFLFSSSQSFDENTNSAEDVQVLEDEENVVSNQMPAPDSQGDVEEMIVIEEESLGN